MNDEQLFNLLITFYQDPKHDSVYAGRWDVWCIQNKKWAEYHMLLLKTDDQLKNILTRARERAYAINHSPLVKALE